MFHKLRRQLTIICATGTALVLIAMSGGSLLFSVSRVKTQYEDAFRGNMNNVFYYLQAQAAIDQTWLSRTETDSGLLIGIRLEDRVLRHTMQNTQRRHLTERAFDEAVNRHGFDFSKRPDGVTPETVEFLLTDNGLQYRAAVATVPLGELRAHIAMVKSRDDERATIRQICLVFAAFTILAILSLAAFAYFFTGRAIRPVRENNQKQAEFVSAASHELRTPLSVFRMGLELLRMQPEKGPEISGKLETECDQMARLVDDLLILARADDHHWSLKPAAFSPKTLLLDTLERYEDIAAKTDNRLIPVISDALPAGIVCDGQRITQVLGILVDNALRYAPPESAIKLGLTRQKNTLAFFVEDSGPGVAPEERERVFERFYRAEQSRTDTGHHGLGLSVAREIITLHGGRIWVEGSESGGARFVFSIPLHRKSGEHS